MKNKELFHTATWLTVFSIAMGYFEAAVVVYLRKLYYPNGFAFPLTPVGPDIGLTEFWREAATIIMLVSIGMLAGKNRQQRFVFFLYCFAVWDLFYYVFLYVILGWPQSLFTWDILFLIPVPWVGPVLCPCVVALTMILLTVVTVYGQTKGHSGKMKAAERIVVLTGCAIILFSFMWDYIQYVNINSGGKSFWSFDSSKDLFDEAKNYVPAKFNWLLFWSGQLLLATGIARFWWRIRKSSGVMENRLQFDNSTAVINE